MCSVRKALGPAFTLASLFGVQMFQYPAQFLNYVHFLTVWSTYVTAFVSVWVWTEFSVLFNSPPYLYMVTANFVTSLMATSLTLLHKKRFQHCLDGLAIINASLSQMEIPDECNELRKLMWKGIGIWCLTAIYFPSVDSQWMATVLDKHTTSMAILIVNYLYMTNFIAFIIICLVLRYINSRFDRINEYVGALTHQSNKSKSNWLCMQRYGVSGSLNPVFIKKQERGFWIIMHVHGDLCKISRDLNRMFGLHVTLEIGTYFMYVFGLVVYTFTGFIPLFAQVSKMEGLSIKLFIGLCMGTFKAITYILRLVYFNHICESISAKANSTRILVHNLLNSTSGVQLHTEILQFVLHTVNRPLKFDGAGFHFGYNYIYQYIGAMSTMLVIILQSATVTDVILLYMNVTRPS